MVAFAAAMKLATELGFQKFYLAKRFPAKYYRDIVTPRNSSLQGIYPAAFAKEHGVISDDKTTAEKQAPSPHRHSSHISKGDHARAAILRQVIEPGGVGAECGVFKGEFSRALLEHLAPRQLYLMDPWYLMTKEWHWGEGDRSTVSALCNILRTFEDDLVSGRVLLKIDDDLKALAELPDHHLDWAYVDSTHLYAPTVKELELLRRKVRPGGIVAGHDWQPDPAHRHHGVCKAVREAVGRGSFELILVDEPTIQWAVRLPG